MKTRIVWTKIWEDDFFVKLNRISKILFLYLITNQRINLSGFYEISDRTIMFDTGLNKVELEKAKKEIFPKAVFCKGWVYILKAKEHGGYKGEKNDVAIKKELHQIPSSIKKVVKSRLLDRVSKKGDRVSGFLDTPINHKPEIINHKSKIIDKDFLKKLKIIEKFSVLNIDDELERWQDWKDSTGKVFKNNQAAFRNWLRKSLDFLYEKQPELKNKKRGIVDPILKEIIKRGELNEKG